MFTKNWRFQVVDELHSVCNLLKRTLLLHSQIEYLNLLKALLSVELRIRNYQVSQLTS
jgi:hypothetical protein